MRPLCEPIPVALAVGLGLSLLPAAAFAVTFFPVAGFEDDVDLIVAENREFLLVPIEGEDGSPAFVNIYDLDATGNVVALRVSASVLGWENGVDPIVVNVAGNQVAVVPMESEDGTAAQVGVIRINNAGAVVAGVLIDLGDLGFEDDVDPVDVFYGFSGAIVPLEKEDGSAAGVLAIKLNAADFGLCTLVSTDVRATVCDDVLEATGLLTGYVDGVDGVGYALAGSARYAVPVEPQGGNTGDLLFFDFDFSIAGAPPAYLGVQSVKAINAGGPRPTPFPGFERDVDIAGMTACLGEASIPLLVPVEEPGGDRGDLYLINGVTGAAIWRYDLANPPPAPRVIGYEEATDVVPWCNLGGVPDDLVAVPTENAKGTDADLLLINMETGVLHASVELANAAIGARVIGFEKGVEPLRWSVVHLLIPEDDERGAANLLVINPAGTIVQFAGDPATNPPTPLFGFERGVDPVVMPVGHPDRVLYVPVERQDQSDADLIILPGPPPSFAGAVFFEAANPGTTVPGYERDVDAIRVNRQDGYCCVYVAEETPDGAMARLRVQDLPSGSAEVLVLPAEGPGPAGPANLFLVSRTGIKIAEYPDVLGYELGLDPTSAVADTLAANPPAPSPPRRGLDADSDNTLTMENSYFGDLDGDGRADALDCAPREGRVFAPPVEVRGLAFSRGSGATPISWDSQDPIAGADTCYDIASGTLVQLRSDTDFRRASCLANDLADTPYREGRVSVAGDGYYYHVRAQNVCGTATYGPPSLDTVATCP